MEEQLTASRIKRIVDSLDPASATSGQEEESIRLVNSLTVQEMDLFLMLYGSDPDRWTRRFYRRLAQICFIPPAVLITIAFVSSEIPDVRDYLNALPPIGDFVVSSLISLPFVVTMLWGTFYFLYAHNCVYPRKWREHLNAVFGEDTSSWPVKGGKATQVFGLVRHSRYTGNILTLFASPLRSSVSETVERMLLQIGPDNVPELTTAHINTLIAIYEWGSRRGARERAKRMRNAVLQAAPFLHNESLNRLVQKGK